MRELTMQECELVSCGTGAPLGSATAGQYFEQCMGYTGPSATLGAAITFAGAIPAITRYVALGGLAWTATSTAICGLGTIQYAQ